MGGVLIAADVYVHRKFSEVAGVNAWGYRGRTVGRKKAGERRVVVLGESTAFGYGVPWRDAFPAALERQLNATGNGTGSFMVSVVNLAYNGEGAHSYRFTLDDYAYLKPDVAVLYTGYADLPYLRNFDTPSQVVYRHDSALFRLTGYFPMLPVIMREKAMVIRYNGRLEDAYLGKATVFRPNLAQRSAASALQAAADVSATLDRYFAESRTARVPDGQLILPDEAARQCGVYAGYCGELYLAVKAALDRGTRVVIASQPSIGPRHNEQQFLMAEYLRERFPDRVQVRFADLGAAIDLRDTTLSFDGMHLTAAGNGKIAESLRDIVKGALDGSAAPADPPRQLPPVILHPQMPEAEPSPALAATAPPSSPAPGSRWIAPVDGREMVWLQSGSFQMGSGETSHRVTIDSGFWMDVTEVTNDAYLRFVGARPAWAVSRLSSESYEGSYLTQWKDGQPVADQGSHPVTAVPWFAARAYCMWAGKRLPTEAEWEYAARAGTTTAYWWGDAFDPSRAVLNHQGTERVGQAARVNPWGLADMAGNALEWTSSWHAPYPYRADEGLDSLTTGGDNRRVLRGGGWVSTPEQLRSAARFKFSPRIAADYIGFRCAQDSGAK